MSIRFLNRLRTFVDGDFAECAQLVNVPELQARQRCPFCYYFGYQDEKHTYMNCVNAHSCLEQSLLWAKLNPPVYLDGYSGPPVTPARVFKAFKMDGTTRYTQLITLDINGYECNRLCAYYPKRIEEKKTVASCAKTNSCGRNGSAYVLLSPSQNYLWRTINYTIVPDTMAERITNFGKAVGFSDSPTIHAVSGVVYVDALDGARWPILNMIPDSHYCGRSLISNGSTNPTLWGHSAYQAPIQALEYIPIFDIDDPLYFLLIQRGMSREQLLG